LYSFKLNFSGSKTETNWSIEIEPLNVGLITIVPISDRTETAGHNNDKRIPTEIQIAEVQSEDIEPHNTETKTTTDYDISPDVPTPIDIIDESTNDEPLGYYEQPEYGDCEIKNEIIHDTNEVSEANTKSKNNTFACEICNRTFTQVCNVTE
jgi:hypothetical protein